MWNYKELKGVLLDIGEYLQDVEIPNSETLGIPVFYGGEFGPDINYVAEHNNLSIKKVIQIHHSLTYLIYMLVFIPGFPYLG